MSDPRISVGVGVFLQRGDRILLGKRIGIRGQGTWGLAGGHLDYGETLENCGRREVYEETGLKVGAMRQLATITSLFDDGKHAVTTFFHTSDFGGEVVNREPEFCQHWQWYSVSSLPSPLFLPLANYLAFNGTEQLAAAMSSV